MKGDGTVDLATASAGLATFGVDELGLDKVDRAILSAICERFGGGPVGLSTLAISVGEQTETVEDVYEPFLIQGGLLMRTPRGRVATAAAFAHLGPRRAAPRARATTRPRACSADSPAAGPLGTLVAPMDTAAVDYDLPPEAIAQIPVEPRDAARLLDRRGRRTAPRHGHIPDLAGLVGPGDVVVVNTTRVLPARLHLRQATGGAVEVLLLEPVDGDDRAVGGARATEPQGGAGHALVAGAGPRPSWSATTSARVGASSTSRCPAPTLLDVLERHGEVPLPAVHHRRRWPTPSATRPPTPSGPGRSPRRRPGCTSPRRCSTRSAPAGADVAPVELVVGLGTFRPIAAERSRTHQMHAERYSVPRRPWHACRAADRVVAVGTTTVRALESAAATGELEGRTDLFIHGARPFAVVTRSLTNFHQPRSSLLVLVDAFVGPRWRDLYEEALADGYRFLSFGDAMFLRGERG